MRRLRQSELVSETTVWNDVLTGITAACKQAMSVVVGLTGTVASFYKVASSLGQALNQDASFEGMKRAAGLVSDAWNQARDDLTKVHDAQQRITASASESEKAAKAESAAFRSLDARPVLQFTRNLDDNAAAAKRASKSVDEYAKFLEDIRKKTVALTSGSNPLGELMDDPKFQKLSADRQANLVKEMTAYLEKQGAMALDKQATDDLAKSQVDAANAQAAWNKSLEDYASTQLDALDPMRENAREMAMIEAALEKTMITQDQYNKLVSQSTGKLHDALERQNADLKKLPPEFQALQQAIEGFGKQSSDAMVDFVFASKDVSTSFSQMVSSILKDLAKMLVYQNVMKPLFGMLASGVTGGGWAWGGVAAAATPRMGGGPVVPGGLYEANEVPGRHEYFIPNVPGKIISDAGAANGTGGSNVTVTVHMHRDENATQDTRATDNQAAALGQRIASVVRQVLVTEKRAGGILAPALR